MTLWKTVSTICIRATSSVGGSTIPSRDKSLLRMVEPFIYNFCQNTVKLHWKSLFRLYKSQYVEKRKQKIPTEVAKMKKKKMVKTFIDHLSSGLNHPQQGFFYYSNNHFINHFLFLHFGHLSRDFLFSFLNILTFIQPEQ